MKPKATVRRKASSPTGSTPVLAINSRSARSRARGWWRNEIRPLFILALIIFSIRSSFADWNDVPTGSRKPTILEGDRVFVNRLACDLKTPFTTLRLAEWGNPERGDIVVLSFDRQNYWLPRWQRFFTSLRG